MEEQIKMARLNAEYNKKQNDLKARKQMVENLKHTRLQHVDDEYHAKKRELLADIADLRKQKEGLALDAVPAEYKTTKVEVVADKTAIKKAIQSGEDVPGAHLVENVSLTIK